MGTFYVPAPGGRRRRSESRFSDPAPPAPDRPAMTPVGQHLERGLGWHPQQLMVSLDSR